MFDNKKDADLHDKMLELGEGFTQLLEKMIPGVDEDKAEAFGLFLAQNKEAVIAACKGKPEALAAIDEAPQNSNVAQLDSAAG